jgi:ADP-heptose:LPS heptosyltransferase
METILFVELLGGIGDLVIALPAIQALARSHPSAQFTVLTFAAGAEILATDPLIDRVISIEQDQPQSLQGARQAVEKLLAHHSYDLIVSDTTYDGIDQVIQQSGAARVVTNLWRSPPIDQRVGERFLEILRTEGLITPGSIAPPQLRLTPAEYQLAQARLGNVLRPLIVLYPDASLAIKRWPVTNFIHLGQALWQTYRATLLIPVGCDPEQASYIAQGIGRSARIWQRGTLREFAALLSFADLIIAGDTGPAHIAATLNIPTITLFGPSWHERYGHPLPHLNLQGYSPCPERTPHNFTLQSCWSNDQCPLRLFQQTCLEAISVEQVLETIAKIFFSAISALTQR